jgi:hypothetical protein
MRDGLPVGRAKRGTRGEMTPAGEEKQNTGQWRYDPTSMRPESSLSRSRRRVIQRVGKE